MVVAVWVAVVALGVLAAVAVLVVDRALEVYQARLRLARLLLPLFSLYTLLALLVRLKQIVGLVGTTRRSTLLISRPLDWLRSWAGRLPGRMS